MKIDKECTAFMNDGCKQIQGGVNEIYLSAIDIISLNSSEPGMIEKLEYIKIISDRITKIATLMRTALENSQINTNEPTDEQINGH